MFHYIPAGYLRKIYVLYVQYKDKVTDELSYSMRYIEGKQVTILNLPDRFVTIAPQGLSLDITYDYSEVLDLRSNTSDANAVDYSLVSAENLISSDTHHLAKRKGHRIFGDSGGAQLKFGSSVYVNPYEVIEAFNDVCDIGVSLDVAPRNVDVSSKSVVEASCAIQRRNNNIFAERAREDLVLLNVVQGYTLEKRLEWEEKTSNERFTGIAFGSAETDFNLRTLNISGMISALPDKEHYHVFGVGSPYHLAVFSYLGKWVNYLTSDSTTYIQAGRFRRRFNFTKEGRIETQVLSKTKVKIRPTRLNTLDCNCAVCKALKYASAFELNCGVLAELLIYHNAVAFANYSHFCNNLARTTKDADEYYNYLRNVFPKGDSNMLNVASSLRIIDSVMNEGYKIASKKFSKYQTNESVNMGSIFASSIQKKDDYDIADDSSIEANTGLNGFNDMWSSCADIIPRYLTKEKMEKFGINLKKIPGIDDWKETEEYRKKKNLLQSSNIWISELLEELKQEGKYPIEVIKNDIVKSIAPKILEKHWEYPMAVKDKDKMLDIIRQELEKDAKLLNEKHKQKVNKEKK